MVKEQWNIHGIKCKSDWFWHKPLGHIISAMQITHMLSITFCPVNRFHSNFFSWYVIYSGFSPLPFVVNSARVSLQHFNLCCCSPSLKASLLNESPPWLCSADSSTPPWFSGTMALHKGPESIHHLRHQISPAWGDSYSKSHSLQKK